MPALPALVVFAFDALVDPVRHTFRRGTAHFLSAAAQQVHIACVSELWDANAYELLAPLDPEFKRLGAPNLRGTFFFMGNVRAHSMDAAMIECMQHFGQRDWSRVLVVGAHYDRDLVPLHARACRTALFASDAVTAEHRRHMERDTRARLVYDVDDVYAILLTER